MNRAIILFRSVSNPLCESLRKVSICLNISSDRSFGILTCLHESREFTLDCSERSGKLFSTSLRYPKEKLTNISIVRCLNYRRFYSTNHPMNSNDKRIEEDEDLRKQLISDDDKIIEDAVEATHLGSHVTYNLIRKHLRQDIVKASKEICDAATRLKVMIKDANSVSFKIEDFLNTAKGIASTGSNYGTFDSLVAKIPISHLQPLLEHVTKVAPYDYLMKVIRKDKNCELDYSKAVNVAIRRGRSTVLKILTEKIYRPIILEQDIIRGDHNQVLVKDAIRMGASYEITEDVTSYKLEPIESTPLRGFKVIFNHVKYVDDIKTFTALIKNIPSKHQQRIFDYVSGLENSLYLDIVIELDKNRELDYNRAANYAIRNKLSGSFNSISKYLSTIVFEDDVVNKIYFQESAILRNPALEKAIELGAPYELIKMEEIKERYKLKALKEIVPVVIQTTAPTETELIKIVTDTAIEISKLEYKDDIFRELIRNIPVTHLQPVLDHVSGVSTIWDHYDAVYTSNYLAEVVAKDPKRQLDYNRSVNIAIRTKELINLRAAAQCLTSPIVLESDIMDGNSTRWMVEEAIRLGAPYKIIETSESSYKVC